MDEALTPEVEPAKRRSLKSRVGTWIDAFEAALQRKKRARPQAEIEAELASCIRREAILKDEWALLVNQPMSPTVKKATREDMHIRLLSLERRIAGLKGSLPHAVADKYAPWNRQL